MATRFTINAAICWSARRASGRNGAVDWNTCIIPGQTTTWQSTPAAPVASPRPTASSRSTSWSPTWTSIGGSPRRSAWRGDRYGPAPRPRERNGRAAARRSPWRSTGQASCASCARPRTSSGPSSGIAGPPRTAAADRRRGGATGARGQGLRPPSRLRARSAPERSRWRAVPRTRPRSRRGLLDTGARGRAGSRASARGCPTSYEVGHDRSVRPRRAHEPATAMEVQKDLIVCRSARLDPFTGNPANLGGRGADAIPERDLRREPLEPGPQCGMSAPSAPNRSRRRTYRSNIRARTWVTRQQCAIDSAFVRCRRRAAVLWKFHEVGRAGCHGCGCARDLVQALVGGVHSGRSRRRSTSRKRGSCRRPSKNGSGASDPVLHGSFAGASLELAQRLLVFAETRVDEREIEGIDIAALSTDRARSCGGSRGRPQERLPRRRRRRRSHDRSNAREPPPAPDA